MAETVEVHNVWTIYGVDENGQEVEEKMACAMVRPQDWGSPSWHYDQVKLEWTVDGITYINHCHMWTDVKRETAHEYLQMFAGLITQITIPGMRPETCGKEFLIEDDFWRRGWGKQPSFFETPEWGEE